MTVSGVGRTANARAVQRDPSRRAHSTRQRVLILEFPTAADAVAYDRMGTLEALEQIVAALADEEVDP